MPENLSISRTDSGFRIEGYPDAEKLIKLDGPKAKRLADLALHGSDLEFSNQCLASINAHPDLLVRESLWRSAIIFYCKCFGGSASRFKLDFDRVYKSEPEAENAFSYFQSLRNKHLVHDENSYSQCSPGAVLNKREHESKIAKIVTVSHTALTLEQGNYANLELLISKAMQWVKNEYDVLCAILTSELEEQQYDTLLAKEGLLYRTPTVEDLDKKR